MTAPSPPLISPTRDADQITVRSRMSLLLKAKLAFVLALLAVICGLVLFTPRGLSPDGTAWLMLAILALGWGWVLVGYWIYDALFESAAARWPIARDIRKAIGGLVKSLVLSHTHHHS
jgi:hypothetical protein